MHNHTTPPNPADMRNLIIAVVLCTGLLFLWQEMYVAPQRQAEQQKIKTLEQAAQGDVAMPSGDGLSSAAEAAVLTRSQALEESGRVQINAPAVHGSINLKGLRLDDLTLVRHHLTPDETSPEVVLLSPAKTQARYFVQFGWLGGAGTNGVQLPDANTVWQADRDTLTAEAPVTFTWASPQGLTFSNTIALDENYLFTLTQRVTNNSGSDVQLLPYGLINRTQQTADRFSALIHTGPIAVVDGELVEESYGDVADDGKISFNNATSWLGMADKYWLTAFIPQEREAMAVNFQHIASGGDDRTQVDYLSQPVAVPAGGTVEDIRYLFAGAKELNVLERYEDNLNIALFDRALDFGVLYFLTYPIFKTLDFFYHLIGNFGLAIMLFVVLLKIVLFPLSNKSYHSMAQMRKLQPELENIKKRYGDDKMRQQQEIMKLWQKEKVNPMSGCLPILIQIPIFFALYKTLLVTIEMRHAPFYGWIHDLSVKDPTNIFTLFGLIPWNPPEFMHLGALPIIMCITMILQQKLNPKPTDPIQAKVMGLLPYLFLFLFASFPAGLLLYWAWNNVLSILQQWIILRRYERKEQRRSTASASS